MNQPLERLRINASKCRDLASNAMTPAAKSVLTDIAEQYEEEAAWLEMSGVRHRPAFRWTLDPSSVTS